MNRRGVWWIVITINASSSEAIVLRYLLSKYPVTKDELEDILSLPGKTLERVLKKLVRRRIIRLEPLPGKIYVRLLRMDIRFVGINPSQRKALKHAGGRKTSGAAADENDYSYQ